MADSGEYTPETIASRQKIADQLLMQAVKPREIRHWAQGLGQLGEAGLGGWLGYKAEEEQKQGSAAQAGAIASLLNPGAAMPGAATGAPLTRPASAPEPVSVVKEGDFNSIDALASPAGKFDPNYADTITAARRAVGKVESQGSGGYSAVGPPIASGPMKGQRALGFNQVMEGNVPQWSKDATGTAATPQQFMDNPDLQNTVFNDRFGKDYQKFGNIPDAASMWFSGKPLAEAGGRRDQLGTTVPGYVQKVGAALAQPATPAVAAAGPTMASGASPMAEKVATMLRDPNPYVRKAGMQLGTSLVQKQLEGDKPTDEMREYQLYKQQGGKDSFFDYKSGLKKAGAQNIAVNNTVNPIVKGVGERFNDTMDAGTAAIPQIKGIHEARKALDQGAFTGSAADPKLFLAKVGNLFGLTNEQASNTEVARSAIGNSVLAKAKTLGANPSNTDRDYIEKVVGGQVQLEETSIRRLLDMQEKWARDSIKRANEMGGKLLKAQPKELEQIGPLLSIDEPPSYDEFLKANPIAPAATTAAPPLTTKGPLTHWERGPDGKPRRVQ